MPLSPKRAGPEQVAVEGGARPPLVAIVVSTIDWHARALSRGLAAAGARAITVKLSSCSLETTSPSLVRLPGCDEGLPDAVLVRSIPGGTFEAVTLRLGILHALSSLGVTVWNDPRAIERCVDKSTTSFLLARAGLPTPPTWTVESREAACKILRRELSQGPLVAKPLFGSQGRGLTLIRTLDDLPEPERVAGVYYLQRYVGVERDGFRDFRLLVSRGRIVASMMRHSRTWITNVKQGGKPIAAVVDPEMKELAIAATAAVGADFAGVDIVHCAQGRPRVLEVNSMPAWSGLQRVTPNCIARVIAEDLLAALSERTAQGAAG